MGQGMTSSLKIKIVGKGEETQEEGTLSEVVKEALMLG